MAVTKGHGNPNWTREEVILALDLYNELKGSIPGPSDKRVIALSKELRSLPYHREASKVASFRNPAGVAFKLQNIRQVAGGQGLSHTAHADRKVWEDFGGNQAATAGAAARIRSGLRIAQADEPPDEDFEFAEGRAVTEAHKRIERNRSIRKKLLKARSEAGALRCDLCACTGEQFNESVRESIFEAHHTKPIAQAGEVKTKLSDMALLCANCHRLVHRLMNMRKGWIGIEEAKNALASRDA
jgi:5-methylcytosine-specific restriction protein A